MKPTLFVPSITREFPISIKGREWFWIPGTILFSIPFGIKFQIGLNTAGVFTALLIIYLLCSFWFIGNRARMLKFNGTLLVLERRGRDWFNNDDPHGGLFPDIEILQEDLKLHTRNGLVYLASGSKQYFIASGQQGALLLNWLAKQKVISIKEGRTGVMIESADA